MPELERPPFEGRPQRPLSVKEGYLFDAYKAMLESHVAEEAGDTAAFADAERRMNMALIAAAAAHQQGR
jgi:hypothetical protein